MTWFQDRQPGEERGFVLHEERAFRRNARRNVMLGTWAANRLGLGGDRHSRYVARIVDLGILGPDGDDAIIARLSNDFADAGLPIGIAEVTLQIKLLDAPTEH